MEWNNNLSVSLSSSLITLTLKRDLPHEISFLGYKINPLRAGQKVKVPLPIARILVDEGYASYDEESIPNVTEINKIAWMEARTDELQELPPNFYYLASLLVKKLKEKVINEKDLHSERHLLLVRSTLLDIIKCRLQKIVKIALANPTPSKEIISKMSFEEEMLYLSLCKLLSSWIEFMRKVIEGEEYD